ncbi:SAM-dependent methyltransferase [Pseudonocardia sp. EC080610-09]|uniref:class I SAM-dependent methyltransferase n=1 Tax=unclassified Pseudonocardia TaxID=2619320 RepID=UPI000705B607|nr:MULTISPECIES: class I SAM-dependent methyltransferase [unclassified Pseudonocardia]ALL76463.1 SAM-dependent methyltransferase [Pseudonocardia sp. EC080610-09]ALL83489.1 SAM-dependent methyltransferase [Pseudonocardia sp. EC080619-01]
MQRDLPDDWTAWKDRVDLGSYDARWAAMAEAGENPHGEADLVQALLDRGPVLDGGCGTGRVGIELDRRGIDVVGVDPDPDMIAAARAKAPGLRWLVSGLESLDLAEEFGLVVLAGNVIPYATDRPGLLAGCARHLRPGGLLLAGYTLRPDWPTVGDVDGWCAAAGLEPVERWSTWDRAPWDGGDYAVTLHARR